jgi:DNA-binding NarL/FixJ family response regulator
MGLSRSTRKPVRHNRRWVLMLCRHPLAQERFGALLAKAGCEVVLSEFCPAEATDASSERYCAAIIDGNDQEAGLQWVRTLREWQPNLPVVVLLPHLEDCVTHPLLRQGVKGLLSYAEAPRGLSQAVLRVASGGYWVRPAALSSFLASILPELQGSRAMAAEVEISRRQHEVLDLLLENLSNKEIAGKLFVSERTVKFHVSNLLSKFHARGRADLIILWMRSLRLRHCLPTSAPASLLTLTGTS